MHIVFKLPTGAGGIAAQHRVHMLRQRLAAWSELHKITVKNVTNGYLLCVEFEKPTDYTLFALSWNITSSWDRYEIVE